MGQPRALPQQKILQAGQIAVWYYQSSGSGVFYADVWRHEGGNNNRLIGKNRIDVQTTAEGVYVGISAYFEIFLLNIFSDISCLQHHDL